MSSVPQASITFGRRQAPSAPEISPCHAPTSLYQSSCYG